MISWLKKNVKSYFFPFFFYFYAWIKNTFNKLSILDLGLKEKYFLLQFFVDILILGSGSVDPHIFANSNPDPGTRNVADPMDPDPDPEHWSNVCELAHVEFVFWPLIRHRIFHLIVLIAYLIESTSVDERNEVDVIKTYQLCFKYLPTLL